MSRQIPPNPNLQLLYLLVGHRIHRHRAFRFDRANVTKQGKNASKIVVVRIEVALPTRKERQEEKWSVGGNFSPAREKPAYKGLPVEGSRPATHKE